MVADFERVLLDVLVVDHFERRQALRHADRVAAEGVEVDAVLHHLGDAGRSWSCAPSGAPLPMPLAIVTMSGMTSQF